LYGVCEEQALKSLREERKKEVILMFYRVTKETGTESLREQMQALADRKERRKLM